MSDIGKTVLTKEQLEKMAFEWVGAERAGGPAEGLAKVLPRVSAADAYALQFATLRRQRALGETLSGRKIAFTADKMRAALGLAEPAFGYMLKKDLHPSGFELAENRYSGALLEPEIAFRFGKDLRADGTLSAADVLGAVAGVCPAFEIVKGRVRSEGFCLADMIADNASFGGAVIGGDWTPVLGLDFAGIGATVAENGKTVARGSGAGVMGSPLNAVVWLANRLRSFGDFLHVGEVVISGSFTAQIPVRAGKTYAAGFTDLGEVRVGAERLPG